MYMYIVGGYISLAGIQEQYEQEGFNITRPHVHSQGDSEGFIDGRYSMSMSVNEGDIHDEFVSIEVSNLKYLKLYCHCIITVCS